MDDTTGWPTRRPEEPQSALPRRRVTAHGRVTRSRSGGVHPAPSIAGTAPARYRGADALARRPAAPTIKAPPSRDAVTGGLPGLVRGGDGIGRADVPGSESPGPVRRDSEPGRCLGPRGLGRLGIQPRSRVERRGLRTSRVTQVTIPERTFADRATPVTLRRRTSLPRADRLAGVGPSASRSRGSIPRVTRGSLGRLADPP